MALEVAQQQVVVNLGDCLDQLGVVALHLVGHLAGRLGDIGHLAGVRGEVPGVHADQIDVALERLAPADGQLEGDGVRVELLAHGAEQFGVVARVLGFDPVQEDHHGQAHLARHAEQLANVGVEAARRVDDQDGGVGGRKGLARVG
ncbi:hypothetical protein D3C72_515580 [compost metagenome]